MEVTTEFEILTREEAIDLITAMREEVAQARVYCERYKLEKEERERAEPEPDDAA